MTLVFWTISNIIGSLIGSAINIDLQLFHFALTALFIYMIVVQLKDEFHHRHPGLIGFLAAFFMVLTKSTSGLVLSTLAASFIGFAVEATIRSLIQRAAG